MPFLRRKETPHEAETHVRKLIESQGQSDREPFCVILLNAKNEEIGVNIVSTGSVTSALVCPHEVLKFATLANTSAIILAHNHLSGGLSPSPDDSGPFWEMGQESKLRLWSGRRRFLIFKRKGSKYRCY